MILHTSDAGKSWKPQPNQSGNLYSICGPKDGYLLWAAGANRSIVHSSDSGKNWKAHLTDIPTDLYSICASGDGRLVWAVGDFGLILHSTDGGEHWEQRDIVLRRPRH
jgi:photosystem II stability/assembly factor-like uncharacterized protein